MWSSKQSGFHLSARLYKTVVRQSCLRYEIAIWEMEYRQKSLSYNIISSRRGREFCQRKGQGMVVGRNFTCDFYVFFFFRIRTAWRPQSFPLQNFFILLQERDQSGKRFFPKERWIVSVLWPWLPAGRTSIFRPYSGTTSFWVWRSRLWCSLPLSFCKNRLRQIHQAAGRRRRLTGNWRSAEVRLVIYARSGSFMDPKMRTPSSSSGRRSRWAVSGVR